MQHYRRLADVFSLATHGQLEDVERLLQNVLEGTQKAIETFAHGENLVTRIATLTNERFENMNQILNLTERTIHEEHTRLMAMRDRQDGMPCVCVCAITGNVIICGWHGWFVRSLVMMYSSGVWSFGDDSRWTNVVVGVARRV